MAHEFCETANVEYIARCLVNNPENWGKEFYFSIPYEDDVSWWEATRVEFEKFLKVELESSYPSKKIKHVRVKINDCNELYFEIRIEVKI